jgi:hypothetical protein
VTIKEARAEVQKLLREQREYLKKLELREELNGTGVLERERGVLTGLAKAYQAIMEAT